MTDKSFEIRNLDDLCARRDRIVKTMGLARKALLDGLERPAVRVSRLGCRVQTAPSRSNG